MVVERIRVAATVEHLTDVIPFVEARAVRSGLEASKTFKLLVAVEEAFVNICRYAYPDGEGEAEISCGVDEDVFVLETADHGCAFDVLSLPDPDTSANVADRKIGGLGVHLIRTFADGVSYRREDGRNLLRLEFRRTPDGLS